MRPATLIILLGAAVLMGQGCAGTPKAPAKDGQAIFRSFDLNQDGRISRNEFVSQVWDRKLGGKIFTELDANQDGYLSPEEAAAKPALMQEASKLAKPPELK